MDIEKKFSEKFFLVIYIGYESSNSCRKNINLLMWVVYFLCNVVNFYSLLMYKIKYMF